MKYGETIKSALNALRLNKVRAFLTMLGIIIGVFSVVVLVAAVKGVQNYVSDQFSELGSDLVFIAPGKVSPNQDPSLSLTNNKLDHKHIDLINLYLKDKITGVTPYYEFIKVAKVGSKTYTPTVMGGDANIPSMFSLRIKEGRWFTKNEVAASARVVVLGPETVRKLFGAKNPVGDKVKIDDDSFEVIGVFQEKGPNFDGYIDMPYTTVKDVYKLDKYSSIVLQAKKDVDIALLRKETELTLLRDLKKEDFSVLTQQEILASVGSILDVLTLGLGAIAGISLLVGGIGIMNIMLVSVTERTQEIGLRKALGATSFNISLQFMFESVFLSICGGAIGLALAWILTLYLSNFFRAEIPWWATPLALGFAFVEGLVFGTYPAIKASRKDPIEALRFE